MIQTFKRALAPLLFFLLMVVGLESVARLNLVASFILAPPSQVLTVMRAEFMLLSTAFADSALSALLGLSLSLVVGIFGGILIANIRLLKDAVYPYSVFLQTVPIVALAPLLVIWFGYGRSSVVASSFIVSLFPMIAATVQGIQAVDTPLRELFLIYRANRLATLLHLQLPFALPYIFGGLRVSAGLAVIGAIVGEFIAGSGLGTVIESSRVQYRVDLMFAAILLSTFLGILFFLFINFLSWMSLRNWHVSEVKK